MSPVNLAGPVSPVWCSVPQPSEPSSCSVDFIGKWFLREVQRRIWGINMNQPYYINLYHINDIIHINTSFFVFVLRRTHTHILFNISVILYCYSYVMLCYDMLCYAMLYYFILRIPPCVFISHAVSLSLCLCLCLSLSLSFCVSRI